MRKTEILATMRQNGKASVEELASQFGVTVQTIRRDLSELVEEGKVERVHGGAIIRSGVSNIEYEERRNLNAKAKDLIARKLASHIPDNVSLFMNIGTTTEAVARALRDHRNLTVVTNNLNVANILAGNESCEIIVAGGNLRRRDGGLVGDLAIQAIELFKVDIAIIGTSALDEEGDLLDFDMREVGVSKKIIRQARKVYLVTDASKFERTAPVRIASLSEMEAIYTDKPLPKKLAKKCEEWGTKIVVVPGREQ